MTAKRTKKEFVELANSIHKNKYKYTKVKYNDSWTKVIITCLLHGDWSQDPASHLAGHGCPGCKFKKLSEMYITGKGTFIKQAKKVHGKLYDYSRVVYLHVNKKIEVICSIHGSFFPTPYNHIKRTSGCPECNRKISKGENLVELILTENKIKFEKQKTFPGLKGKRKSLVCDFWIPSYNMIIEYDGIQHFQSRFNSKKREANGSFADLQRCDKIKNNYASKEGLQMVRIPYLYKTREDIVEFINPYFQQALV